MSVELSGVVESSWLSINESLHRAALAPSPERTILAGLVDAPLDDTLPLDTINKLAATGVIDPTAVPEELGSLLAQAPLPSSLLEGGITPSYHRYNKTSGESGITLEQHTHVARRYKFARDVKILSLISVIDSGAMDMQPTEDGGTLYRPREDVRMVVAAEHADNAGVLLNPRNWHGRTQLKDRVYRANIGGDEYIMKERKTPYHTDLKRGGHVEGRSSEEEFKIGTYFAGVGSVAHPEMRLHWERPVGHVAMPGYEFCIFEAEPNMLEGDEINDPPTRALAKAISRAKESYKEEYETVRQAAAELYDNRNDLLRIWSTSNSALRRLNPWEESLSFKEFARMKAHVLIREAYDFQGLTIRRHGYTNSDIDGLGFRVHEQKGRRPNLEVIGFDYEYYEHDPAAATEEQETWEDAIRDGNMAFNRVLHMGFCRKIAAAAALAMMQQKGHGLPALGTW